MAVGDPHIDPYGYPARRPKVRFDAISEAWEMFRDQPGAWILAGFVVLVGNGALNAAAAAVFGHSLPRGGGGFRVALPPAGQWVEFLLSAVLNGFFLGGMFRMACLQVRGQRVHVGDLFGVRDVAQELIVGSLLYGLAVFVGGLCLILPAFVAAGVLMFTLPLIVDGRLTAFDAVRASWRALKGQWLSVTVFHTVLQIFSGLGVCCFVLGLLFTMPLYVLAISALYRDFFLGKGQPSGDFAKPAGLDPEF